MRAVLPHEGLPPLTESEPGPRITDSLFIQAPCRNQDKLWYQTGISCFLINQTDKMSICELYFESPGLNRFLLPADPPKHQRLEKEESMLGKIEDLEFMKGFLVEM